MPQGTVKSYDPQQRTAVLLDDGLREIATGPLGLARSGLRELRIGQRVRFTLEDDPDDSERQRATNVNVVSL